MSCWKVWYSKVNTFSNCLKNLSRSSGSPLNGDVWGAFTSRFFDLADFSSSIFTA